MNDLLFFTLFFVDRSVILPCFVVDHFRMSTTMSMIEDNKVVIQHITMNQMVVNLLNKPIPGELI